MTTPTSTTVIRDSCDVLMTSMVFSQQRLHTPSTPVNPIPSTMSRVKRKGTVSGVGRNFPCSNATPGIHKTRGTVFDWSTIWSTIPVSIPSQGKNYSLSLIFGKCSETFVSPLDVWSIFGNLRNVTEYLQKMVKNVVFSIFIKYTKQDTGARGFEISLLSRCAHPWEIERSTRRQISYLRAPMS